MDKKALGKPEGKNWHRRAVGPGPWEAMGKYQAQYLINNGLKPQHFFLEVGCGALRGGVHLIRYLETGHYFAIDNESSLLEAAVNVEIPENRLQEKRPTLFLTRDFDLSFVPIGVRFNMAWAHSVFTHLNPEQIKRCMSAVGEHLVEDGIFFATFNEAKITDLSQPHGWRDELLTTRYPRDKIGSVAEEARLDIEFIGDWGTMENERIAGVPGKRQQMIALRKRL